MVKKTLNKINSDGILFTEVDEVITVVAINKYYYISKTNVFISSRNFKINLKD